MGKTRFIRQMQNRRQPPKRVKAPRDEKECLDRIARLEYRRMKLPKIANPRVLLRWDALTKEIKLLYDLLETFRREKSAKKNKK